MAAEGNEPGSRLLRFIRELKRRGVYQIGAAYAAGAFVLWQAADIVVAALELPGWVLTAVVVGAVAGFPAVLALAWAFDITPGGLRRTVSEPEPTPEEPPRHRVPLPLRIGLAAVVVLAAAALAWWSWPAETLAFSEGDAILLADFDNRTGDSLFDGTLETAFRVTLQQSPYANVVSSRRVRTTLERMQREPDSTSLSPAVSREIAQREGIPAVVVPSITGVGGQYVLAYELQDPDSGDVLGSETVRVDGRGSILEGVDELAVRLREFLGESRQTISRHQEPLAKVTTHSLQALRAYSLANDNIDDARWGEARRLLQRALEIDSSFTAARAQLGMTEYEHFDRDAGREKLRTALRHSEGLTEHEALGIRAFYAQAVEGDLGHAEEIYRALVDMYPHRIAPHHNLGRVLARAGRPEEAVRHYRRALEIDRSFNLSYYGLNHLYLYRLGRVDSALALAIRRVEIDSTFVWAWDHLGWAYLGVDSLEAARAAFERALEIRPDFIRDLYRLGHTHRLAGRHREAADAFRRVLEVDSMQYGAHYQLGVVHRMTGREDSARKEFRRYLDTVEEIVEANPDRAYDRLDRARALTRLGRRDRAWESVNQALSMDSTSRSVHFGTALVASLQGRHERALRHLETAFERGYANYVWVMVHPDLAPLRGHPRFESLLAERLELPGQRRTTAPSAATR